MDIMDSAFIITFVTVGILTGSFLLLLFYAHLKIHKSEKVTRELSQNRLDSYIQGSLNFNR